MAPSMYSKTCTFKYIKLLPPRYLLKSDYKFLARIIANRMRPSLPDIIHPGKQCDITSRRLVMFDVVTGILDIIADAELTRKPPVTGFSSAFYRISSECSFGTLQIHGYSPEQSLFENRPAAIHLSGNVRGLLQFNVLYNRDVA